MINVNSKQTWCYQTSGGEKGSSKDPTYGKSHIFYDETHFFIAGASVAPGSKITFQLDSTNTAAFYWLDVVDLENPPVPLSRPTNSISITDAGYGAMADNPNVDSTAANQKCFNDAKLTGWILKQFCGHTVGSTKKGIFLRFDLVYSVKDPTQRNPKQI
ncbi:MAG: coagulation factor 5/8 type domain protein [Pedosphaera sp.]|nr:coagulation factor 5/8 type domain protein [Pedosphaera sp.]